MDGIEITEVQNPDDLEEVRRMLHEFARTFDRPDIVETITHEARTLPGIFAKPRGALMLARRAGGGPGLGCIALKPLPSPGDGEMRRLYVRPEAQGQRLGISLGYAMIEVARRSGYRRVLLEAQTHMTSALRIYAEVGFQPIPFYSVNPPPGTVYVVMDLTGPAAGDGCAGGPGVDGGNPCGAAGNPAARPCRAEPVAGAAGAAGAAAGPAEGIADDDLAQAGAGQGTAGKVLGGPDAPAPRAVR